MKIKREEIPVAMEAPGTRMRNLKGYGGMTVGFNELPAGTDFTPLLLGLTNNSCQCPHWGYMFEGELLVKYDDGKSETFHQTPAIWSVDQRQANVTIPTKTKIKSLFLDGGIFMDANEADNKWENK